MNATEPDLDALLHEVIGILQRDGRTSYRGLKRRFGIDDEYIEDIKVELIECRKLARDEDGRVLAWVGPAANAEQPAGQAQSALPPERRLLTIMFCDLVGSTELSARLDPEEFSEVLNQYRRVCAQSVERYGGHVAQLLGDGVQAYFGYPMAHEDAVARAALAALAILDALRELGQLGGPEGPSLEVRIGIHRGVVVVDAAGPHERLALGQTPNVAARVQALAEPNTILATAAACEGLRNRFILEPIGEHTLRGIPNSVALFKLGGTRELLFEAEPLLLAPMIGRDADLNLIAQRFQEVRNGHGQTVVVTGESGIGKSRLLQAFRARLSHVEHSIWELRCSAFHRDTAFHPLIEALRRRLQLSDEVEAASALAKLREFWAAAGQPDEALPLIASLLSIASDSPRANPASESPGSYRRRSLEALIGVLLAEVNLRPTVILFEDLHWADPSTLELIDSLAPQVSSVPALVLVSQRCGQDSVWTTSDEMTVITLDRLNRDSAAVVLQDLTRGSEVPAQLLEELLAKADGVPLFLEELTRTVLASRAPAQRATSSVVGHALVELGVPDSLKDSLMARLDRLASGKEVAQLGATLGRSFLYELIAAVWTHGEAQLRSELERVVRARLLLQRGFPPNAVYTFKHALIQDAAYDSMLKRVRRSAHERAATALLQNFPKLVATQPAVVAHHFTEAQLHSQALEQWQLAAERALSQGANREAIVHLQHALRLLLLLPAGHERDKRELRLLAALRPPLIATQGYASHQLRQCCERVRKLCSRVHEPLERWSALWGLWYYYDVTGQFVVARELTAELGQIAQDTQDPDLRLEMGVARGHAFWRGQLREARENFESTVGLYDPQLHARHALRFGQDPLVLARSYLAAIHGLADDLPLATDFNERAIAHARSLHHPYSLAVAVGMAACCSQTRGDALLTRRLADESLAIANEHGFPLWLAQAEVLQGWAEVMLTGSNAAVQQIERGIAHWRRIGARIWRTHQLAMLAEAYFRVGRMRDALEAVQRARALIKENGECFYEAEVLRLEGELHLHTRADVQSARICFTQAAEVAASQGARLFEQRALKAALDLEHGIRRTPLFAVARRAAPPVEN